MALLVPDTGEIYMLQNIVGKNATANTLYLKLYQNAVTPGEANTVADYTEANFTGYANIALTGASWTVSSASGYSNATYAIQTYTSSAAQSTQQIYGYYVTSGPGGQLLWAEKFTDGPYPITNNGDAIKVTPFISLE